MEELNTEKKQTDSNINLENIYSGIRYLKPEYQGIILSTYKLTDLCNILVDSKNYEKYITDLINSATTYINTVGALAALRKEAIKDSEKGKELNLLGTMNQVYDSLPEEFKKKFCEDMLSKREFFEDSFKVIMDSFENAVEVKKDDVRGDVNEKVSRECK